MQVIYLDVLLVFNLYVNYILLRLTARITHSRLPFWRCMGAAGLGSLSTLMIFLPPMPPLLSVLCKLPLAVLLCLAAFGWHDWMRLFWSSICFFGSSFAMAGILLGLSLLFQVRMVQANACWYLDVSLQHLVLFTIVAYLLLSAVQYLHDRTPITEGGYRIWIRYHGCTVQLEGLADTGNALVDFLTGKPVIVCHTKALGKMAEGMTAEAPMQGIRLLPYMTAAGSSLIPVFSPDEVVIRSERLGTMKAVDVLIGVAESETKYAIFNPKLLQC